MTMKLLPDIQKILYATDLSKNARYAFGYAASLANRYGAGVTVLYVMEEVSAGRDQLVIDVIGEEKWKELRETNRQKVLDTIDERLHGFCDDVSQDLPACPFITDKIEIRTGNPVDEILSVLHKGDFDLLVMGAHGHGFFSEAMIGSTSRRVLRRAKKPVLVVRLPKES